MSLDSVSRFTGTVDNYVKYRPSYPKELFEFLKSELGQAKVICELGAGTGIFTRQLAESRIGDEVIAIEPNDSMRAAAVKDISTSPTRIIYTKGTAEVSHRPNGEADCVLGAQCFHWFDLQKALPEISRIAKANALCCAIWNDRIETGFNGDLENLLRKASVPYLQLRRPEQTIQDLHRLVPHGREVQFDYQQDLDLDGVIGRMASTSYVMHGVEDKAGFNQELSKYFHKHARSGKVSIAYKTRVFFWRNIKDNPSKL